MRLGILLTVFGLASTALAMPAPGPESDFEVMARAEEVQEQQAAPEATQDGEWGPGRGGGWGGGRGGGWGGGRGGGWGGGRGGGWGGGRGGGWGRGGRGGWD
ncbi:hypothetical protein N7528_009943 [Penicillium herquei]|nr:hypothetical protein N7528_009943 [Penicillium herquei]